MTTTRDALLPLPLSPVEVSDLVLQAREHVQSIGWRNRDALYTADQMRAYALAAINAALKQQAEPVAWIPISEPYSSGDVIDVLMEDGSILCGLLPQFDGDLWWAGAGTGEKFIDPKMSGVTHWRLNGIGGDEWPSHEGMK